MYGSTIGSDRSNGSDICARRSDTALAGLCLADVLLHIPFAHVSGLNALPMLQSIGSKQLALSWSKIEDAVSTIQGRLRQAAKKDCTVVPSQEQKSVLFPLDGVVEMQQVLCTEYTRGVQRIYRRLNSDVEDAADQHVHGFRIHDEHVTHRRRIREAFADYLLPQGFPDSVAPQYAGYMTWRGVQYFFGGAMSVYTTRSLLKAVGVANKHSGEAAAAINWVVKDGAGRLGRFLFARWGRSLDSELKQFRLAGDVLMETGAALELATSLAPRLFLPLACTANLAKNLAAVAASSTRAPIYRTFAKHHNLADVTAKGESVANLADVIGTVFGIAMTRINLPVVPSFLALSLGYLVASRREVDSVELPYLNRARMSYAARQMLSTGILPGPKESNAQEALLPWSDPIGRRVILGAPVAEACAGPDDLVASLQRFANRNYALTYRPETQKVYVMLRQGADTEAVLRSVLDAHCVLHLIDQSNEGKIPAPSKWSNGKVARERGAIGRLRREAQGWLEAGAPPRAQNKNYHQRALDYVAAQGHDLYKEFKKQAQDCGWNLSLTMLNPLETRLGPVSVTC